jgi:membrane fusion protein (multidrug efflux system)
VAAAKAQSAAVESAQAAVEAYRAAAQSSARMVDQRKSQMAEASSRLAQSNTNAPQQLAISRATLRSKQAQAAVANSRVQRALLDISYTNIVAPVSGVVGKRSVEIGSTVQPGQQLLTIAQIDDLWVTANFKETQLRRMRPGERVTIHVDAFNEDLNGHVESLPASTGAITSLLPPENATGNYVKVVQRLPVRIRFAPNQFGLDRLRPGMSVDPKVWVK